MSKSFYRPRPDNVIEDFEHNHFYHKPSDRHYEMIRRNGEFFQKQYQLDEDGRPINVVEQRIDYVIGSGSHVRTYLYRTPGGELYEFPLAWYSQTSRWGMNPGYDRPNHLGLGRRVERECMFCHNAYPEVPLGTDRLEEPPFFPEDLPEGIGCQRCHGPGAEHVRVAASPVTSIRTLRATIVNPATLAPERRDDVCLQCHLQPMLDPPSFIRIFGRGDYSYRPGEPLHEYLFHVDYDEPPKNPERFEINHHAYRLFQSTCYQRSGGRMSCLTCHNPHRKVPSDEAPAYYKDRCLTCHRDGQCTGCSPHAPSDPASAERHDPTDCVGCHMPKRRTQDVIQVVMTDHKIRRARADANWLAPLKEEEREVNQPPRPYWPSHAPPQPLLDLYINVLAGLGGDRSRLDAMQSALRDLHPANTEAQLYLAHFQTRSDRYREAAESYSRVIEDGPTRSGAQRGLGFALAMLGDYEGAVERLRKAVELAPNTPHYHYLLGSALVGKGRTEPGIAELEMAARLRPHYVNTLMDLGQAYASVGRLRESADQVRHALALEPTDIDANLELGRILLRLGDSVEALRFLRRALTVSPDNPRLILMMAAALVRESRHDEALEAVRRARQWGADDASCLLVAALAHHGTGQIDEAQRDYGAARASAGAHPSDSLVRALLFDLANPLFALPTNGGHPPPDLTGP